MVFSASMLAIILTYDVTPSHVMIYGAHYVKNALLKLSLSQS